MNRTVGNLVGLSIVTGAALVLMLTIAAGTNRLSWVFGNTSQQAAEQHAIPKAPVSVETVEPQMVDIVDVRYGILRPYDKYRFSFDATGILERFGTNEAGEPLDVGDHVKKGQVLAQLQQRRLAAQLREAKSRLEKAEDDMRRAEERKERNIITADEYQTMVANLDVARAQVEIAETRLSDATLISRVDGVIAKRLVSVGQSIGPQQTVFEVHQIDRLLLVVEVPESRIPTIRRGQPVTLTLRASDTRGRPLPPVEGTVYRVAPSADERTGVFEVEIIVDNRKETLKAGQIAAARIVLDRVEGFRLPDFATVTRDGQRMIFSVGQDGLAHRYVLRPYDYLEQFGELILFHLPPEHRTVVVRGQHRLVDGREVQILTLDPPTVDESLEADVEVSRGSDGAAK